MDVAAAAGPQLRMVVTKSQAKRANKPSKKFSATPMAAKSGRKVCKAVAADVAKFRPDLKVSSPGMALRPVALAMARASSPSARAHRRASAIRSPRR